MKNTLTRYLTIAALALAGHAHALQIIDPVEGHNSFIKISAKELTRIAVENGKLRSLIASDGELTVEKDEERGQIFIRPILLDKPINVRIITGSGGTYSLVMQAVDIPQEDIIIREPASKGPKKAAGEGKTTSYVSSLKALVTAMANAESQPSNIEVKSVNQEIALWENTRFVLESVFKDRVFTGEKYRLTNTGKEKLRLVEQELYRKGVLAVAVENHSLDPGQSTNIYVVRGGN